MAKAKKKSARATKRAGRKPIVTNAEAKGFVHHLSALSEAGVMSQAMGLAPKPKRLTRAELEERLRGSQSTNEHLHNLFENVSRERNELRPKLERAEHLVALMKAFVAGLLQRIG